MAIEVPQQCQSRNKGSTDLAVNSSKVSSPCGSWGELLLMPAVLKAAADLMGVADLATERGLARAAMRRKAAVDILGVGIESCFVSSTASIKGKKVDVNCHD